MSSSSGTLRRWTSSDSERQAAEWVPGTTGALTDVLPSLVRQLQGAAFLILCLDDVELAELPDALAAFREAGGRSRICLAGTRITLAHRALEALDNDHVGLLLDDVAESTPGSEIIWDRIEAVRFDADFVMRAAHDLRCGCVLDSLLALSRDLGLCTLGVNAIPGGASVTGRGEFDYLPEPETSMMRRTHKRHSAVIVAAA